MAVPTIASKVFRQVRQTITMEGIWTVLTWLLEHAGVTVALKNQPEGRCLGILHKDGIPENDEYIVIDVRVMGKTVLLGWVQVL